MYAVIKSGGKQYRVEAGKPVRVESLAADGHIRRPTPSRALDVAIQREQSSARMY